MNLMQAVTAATAQRRTERRDDMHQTTHLTSGRLLQPLQFASGRSQCVRYIDVDGLGKLLNQWPTTFIWLMQDIV